MGLDGSSKQLFPLVFLRLFLLILPLLLLPAITAAPFDVPVDFDDSSGGHDPFLIAQVAGDSSKRHHDGGRLDPLVSVARYVEVLFESFIKKYGKMYSGHEEYTHRLNIFKKNLEKAVRHQNLDPGAVHGVTPFSDLSEEEFERDFLGLHVHSHEPPASILNHFGGGSPAPVLPVDNLPENFDWRELGAVTDVKTQGLCGACWAFTTTGVIEGALFLSTGKLVNLSEQQLIDCDKKCDPKQMNACDSGCKGGLMTNAYEYIKEAGGLMTAEDYPYKGSLGQCSFKQEMVAVRLENYSIISVDEDQIAANLVRYGPLAVGLNAAFMQTYIGGVSCPLLCSKNFVNHGVLLVGYQKSGFAPLRMGNRPYWILKNSWGPRWGEKGFYKLCRGMGECGINTMVSAVAAVKVAATPPVEPSTKH